MRLQQPAWVARGAEQYAHETALSDWLWVNEEGEQRLPYDFAKHEFGLLADVKSSRHRNLMIKDEWLRARVAAKHNALVLVAVQWDGKPQDEAGYDVLGWCEARRIHWMGHWYQSYRYLTERELQPMRTLPT